MVKNSNLAMDYPRLLIFKATIIVPPLKTID
jgi:hypothetical protein